jgi:hypothetical protein
MFSPTFCVCMHKCVCMCVYIKHVPLHPLKMMFIHSSSLLLCCLVCFFSVDSIIMFWKFSPSSIGLGIAFVCHTCFIAFNLYDTDIFEEYIMLFKKWNVSHFCVCVTKIVISGKFLLSPFSSILAAQALHFIFVGYQHHCLPVCSSCFFL